MGVSNSKDRSKMSQYRLKTREASSIGEDFTYESPEDYLSQHGVSEDSIKFPEDEVRAEANHHLQTRSIILLVLVIQMLIIPIWLMILLILPAFNKESKISQPMQGAILTAIISDFAGLYYIITRDLFPQKNRLKGNPLRTNKADEDLE